ncbi:cytochrome c-type biogenesis protein CcmF [endosymbiont of Acanthamoeba sp. UWC8]|uniref:heme lyase CcmF/NrfE family subunit n=1 Tax=endosymbiont of Acanthamoeba sp. UWC8 TaxID=86106 RepID=UPI0004D105C6|nr:heme lyase CcmF/NrfE family subunit [endosymbiont of Acanthamoeba sp. UWC8]AIF82001.1 cytochrome c-type biogenesis protein CcmF [endosymbiont of Acanthamoeba sp. UWC8]
MYAELGNVFLYIALILCIVIAVSPLYRLRLAYIRIAWYLVFSLTFLAFISLILCFIISDFTVLNVVNNSHTAKPLIYKISGAWGNHEGSMLMWICALSFFSVVFAYLQTTDSLLIRYTLVIQAALLTFFISFVIFTSNPFQRIFPAPLNGYGLNPILQDIGLAMHPPMLYLGYVGFSLIYSGAIAALIIGEFNKQFAVIFKPLVLMSWAFLTLGIGLGSWWAYRELGWGGFWFWDPVENSSLMPWLTATALIHSLIALEKFNKLKHWSLLLSILTFTLSMVGTFLVRSNIITSVHSFAQDPKRGLFILIFLATATGIALILYSIRASKIVNVEETEDYLFSRNTFIVFNNLILTTAAFIVILGTLYPALLEVAGEGKISIGAPYFNSLIGSLGVISLLFIIIGTQLNWGNSKLQKLYNDNKVPFILGGVFAALISYQFKIKSLFTVIGVTGGIWLIISVLNYTLKRIKQLNGSIISMALGHIGFGLLVLAITLNSALEMEVEKPLKVKEYLDLGSFRLTLEKIDIHRGKNYIARVAEFKAFKHNNFITTLLPETRFFPVELQQTTESAIYNTLFYDLYIATGELNEEGILMVRAYYKPMISWVWFSCLLIFLSGMVSLFSKMLKKPKALRKAK